MIKKTLAQYLAEYLVDKHESNEGPEFIDGYPDGSVYLDADSLKDALEQGIEAYQSTENCRIGVIGGDCPDCGRSMDYQYASLYTQDGDKIECGSYECPECGYVVYG